MNELWVGASDYGKPLPIPSFPLLPLFFPFLVAFWGKSMCTVERVARKGGNPFQAKLNTITEDGSPSLSTLIFGILR